MGIKDFLIKTVTIFSAIGTAVFYVLFQQAKKEKKENELQEVKEEKAALEEKVTVVEAMQKAETEVKTENEELVKKATSGHKLSNYHAALDVLSK